MTPADRARENAIQCEMVLYAYRKNKDGVVVSFVIHPNDMPAALAIAPIGARFVSALVMVGDDELPVSPAAKEKSAEPRPVLPKSPAGAKRAFRDLPPPQQAGIHCEDPVFAAFLRETYADDWHETQDAAECVRLICAVSSRSELATNHKARVIWHQLDSQFQAWKAMEHA